MTLLLPIWLQHSRTTTCTCAQQSQAIVSSFPNRHSFYACTIKLGSVCVCVGKWVTRDIRAITNNFDAEIHRHQISCQPGWYEDTCALFAVCLYMYALQLSVHVIMCGGVICNKLLVETSIIM